MSELAKNIVSTLLDDENFVSQCSESLKEILEDKKFDSSDLPEVLNLVVLIMDKSDNVEIKEENIEEVLKTLVVELLKKLDVFDEPSEQVNKMIESCIKLLKTKVKTSSSFKKVKKWFISTFIKCNCTCKC